MDWLSLAIAFLLGCVGGYFVGGCLTVIDIQRQIDEAAVARRLREWVGK
jgi:hypothetical protein